MSSTILMGAVYTIENSFSASGLTFDPILNDGTIVKSPIRLTKIDPTTSFATDLEKWNKTQLILDDHGRYIHTGSTTGAPTQFASYIIVSPLGYTGST